jgi:pSer/pThr/pTyr-binding forkhead associated (FHA) protein
MGESPTWEVHLYVEGPVALRGSISTRQKKALIADKPFYSDIELVGDPWGFKATVTARAPDKRLAFEAAVFFFGRMLDVLAFSIDMPLFLSHTEHRRDHDRRDQQDVRRIITLEELENAFKDVSFLEQNRSYEVSNDALVVRTPSLLRSLGWYRKGLYTDDPFDRFLAFWNSIEIVAARYYRHVPGIDLERGRRGVKNQIWACFIHLWGPCKHWPIIMGKDKWIDESYEIRKSIAHGAGCVSVEEVAAVAGRNDVLRQVAHRFLRDWRKYWRDVKATPLAEVTSGGADAITIAELLTKKGPTAIQRFRLNDSRSIIGRHPEAAICLDSLAVSRTHTQIECDEGAYFVADMGSSNGTYVNGERIDGRVLLRTGDRLEIGPYEFEFSVRRETKIPERTIPMAGPVSEQVSAPQGGPNGLQPTIHGVRLDSKQSGQAQGEREVTQPITHVTERDEGESLNGANQPSSGIGERKEE